MFYLLGCPMHYGVGDDGLIHSLEYLRNHYSNLKNIDLIPEISMPEESLRNLRNLNSVIATCTAIAEKEYTVLTNGKTPLFIAGDHSAVMGSISASSTYMRETMQEDMGLIWVDAHPDINTEATTVSGNIHGMPVAACLGMGEPKLTQFLSDHPKLKPENIVMLGLRDIDPPETEFLKNLHIKHYTYDDILSQGLENCLAESCHYLSHLKGVHLSFDIDSMDPALMPGVSVPVKKGFTKEDVFQIFEIYLKKLPIIAYDIVEFNMEHDINQKTSDFLSELVDYIICRDAEACGKS